MDNRTRKRFMAQYTAMSHLLQRHYSILPPGKSYADILSEGIGAAMALGMVEVQREARFPRQILELVEAMPVPTQDEGGPVNCLATDSWGIGRGLPQNDL